MIIGSAAYMAPEQAKGLAADKRADIWAFGCVLYEMLTGRRAFDGAGVTDTLAAVLRGDPDWTALPADLAPATRTLLTRCLEKDRGERVQDISVAKFVLEKGRAGYGLSGLTTASGRARRPPPRGAVPRLALAVARGRHRRHGHRLARRPRARRTDHHAMARPRAAPSRQAAPAQRPVRFDP